ncbi:alpha-tocopherol transfer protein-like [Musca domestica]|uniref:Alpha-tocopherol transfer protein-like n=1 Tax=Musca domestica TaxID=7370 RepID=T1PI87_MUSDO|nr:alpha-tocopherol transfer protein-like [Musca domestica]
MVAILPLTEEQKKVAITELGEVTSRVPEDLQALKDWIKKQPHLRARTDEQFLIQFLRGCKFSLEKAKEKIDNYYALKTKYPELLRVTDVDDPDFRRFHNVGSYCVLPTPLHDNGPRILFNHYTYGPNDFSIEQVLCYGVAVSDVLMVTDPQACINGVFYVLDFAKATTSHVMSLTPNLVKKMIDYYVKTLPFRIKGICCINLAPYALHALKMLVEYAPEKIKNRVFLCGSDLSAIEEEIPKKYFPLEYGGENGSVNQLYVGFNKVWDDHREYFKENADYGTDEHLRVGKKMNFGGDVAIGGSFRKIEVD